MFSRKGAIAAALPADLDTGTGRSSPGSTNLQRIRIDILCRSNRGSPFAPSSPRTPLAARKIPAEATPSAEDNEPCKTQEQVDTPRTRYSSGSVARHAPAFCAVDAGANPSERAPTPHASATISGDDGDKSYFTVCLFVASIAGGLRPARPTRSRGPSRGRGLCLMRRGGSHVAQMGCCKSPRARARSTTSCST